jgi:hypothetical protein
MQVNVESKWPKKIPTPNGIGKARGSTLEFCKKLNHSESMTRNKNIIESYNKTRTRLNQKVHQTRLI